MRRLIWEKRKSNLRLLIHRPGTFLRLYRWPVLTLCIGAVLDAITTVVFLSRFGPEAELNPVFRFAAQLLDVNPGVALAKAIQAAGAVFVSALWRPWTAWLLTLCGILYAVGALINQFELL